MLPPKTLEISSFYCINSGFQIPPWNENRAEKNVPENYYSAVCILEMWNGRQNAALFSSMAQPPLLLTGDEMNLAKEQAHKKEKKEKPEKKQEVDPDIQNPAPVKKKHVVKDPDINTNDIISSGKTGEKMNSGTGKNKKNQP